MVALGAYGQRLFCGVASAVQGVVASGEGGMTELSAFEIVRRRHELDIEGKYLDRGEKPKYIWNEEHQTWLILDPDPVIITRLFGA